MTPSPINESFNKFDTALRDLRNDLLSRHLELRGDADALKELAEFRDWVCLHLDKFGFDGASQSALVVVRNYIERIWSAKDAADKALMEQCRIAAESPNDLLKDLPWKEAKPGPYKYELKTKLPEVKP